MRIDSATGINSALTGSFSGSFKGTGDFTGLTADSVAYANVTGKPTLVSGSAQIDHDATTNFSADEHYTQGNITTVGTVTSGDVSAILPSGIVSGSQADARTQLGVDVSGTDNSTDVTIAAGRDYVTISGQELTLGEVDISDDTNLSVASAGSTQGDVNLTLTGDQLSAASVGLGTGNSPTFVGLTLTGDLEVQGTTTTVDSTTVEFADNIIALNGTGAANGGIEVNDGPASGSMLWDGTNNYWIAGAKGSENEILTVGNVDADIKTLSLPASTTISSFGASLVDDADATAARTTLGVDASGTDNSTDVTLTGTPDYLTISGQEITLGTIDISDDTNLAAGTGVTLTGDTLSIGQAVGTSDDVQFDSLGVGTAASGTTGEIRATGDITAYYSSDERLKENFNTLDGALDKVMEMNGYTFDWKEGIEDIVSHTGHDIGVKAQEVQAMYPELVHERDNGYLAVDYIKLTAVLLQAVKELNAKVDKLS